MPRSHRPTVIDGFTSIQAVKRSSSRNPHDKDAPEQAPAPAEPKQRASVKARIGHTAMPRKHEIVCYECGYAFTLQGRVDKTYCPKCRTELQRIDHTLNAQWSGSVKTIGTVTVPEGIALRGGNITACDVVLCGDAKGVTIKASRRIEFGTGGLLDPRHVTCRDILVPDHPQLTGAVGAALFAMETANR